VYIFVGERCSRRARVMGVHWKSGPLAAKTLFDALRACGIDPEAQSYITTMNAACAYGPARGCDGDDHGSAWTAGSSLWARGSGLSWSVRAFPTWRWSTLRLGGRSAAGHSTRPIS
jgi:hypothetical protein